MEDILASIRRILNEDDSAAAPTAEHSAAGSQTHKPEEDGVLVLDDSMLITAGATATAPPSEPANPPAEPSSHGILPRQTLLAPEAEAAAVSSVGTLLRTLTVERHTEVSRGGPTIEDLVREEIRPMLKNWLDANLPPLVERLVRSEIERVMGRATL
jgi:cell pole-organizing protein PopZ